MILLAFVAEIYALHVELILHALTEDHLNSSFLHHYQMKMVYSSPPEFLWYLVSNHNHHISVFCKLLQ